MAFPADIPSMALLVTDFPEPDSPTMASVSPLYRSKEMSLTAWSFPETVRKELLAEAGLGYGPVTLGE